LMDHGALFIHRLPGGHFPHRPARLTHIPA
jgi:hypothetical protein